VVRTGQLVVSGIVAVVRTDGASVSPDLIQHLTAGLAFRGPDAQATRCLGQTALGHARLSAGARSVNDCQPLALDGDSWIVADARVDDRATLVGALSSDGDTPAPSDADLILRAYAKWGAGCFDHLLGDFTFAIWNASSRRLLCACDHLGVRSLFYAHVGPWLVVSNAVECLRRLPDVSDDLDDQAVADFLLFGHREDPSATTFRDIRRLPPAHRLTWEAERGIEVRPYWEFPIEEPFYRRATEYADRLQTLLDQAVSDRVRGERVGICLSGGLDSTAIAATAVRQHRSSEGQPVRGFTFVYQSLIPDDERDAAAAAAAHLGMPVQFYVLDRARGWEAFTEPDAPEPLVPSMHGEPRRSCYADMAAHSRIALDGEGADNALHYEWRAYLSHLRRTNQWTRIAADGLTFLAHRRRPPLLHTLMHGWPRAASDGDDPAIPSWMSIDLVERLHLRERWADVMRTAGSAHPVRPVGYGSLHMPAWQSVFDGLDAAYTRVPLEVAYPFLDLRMLRFLMRVPVVPWCRDKYLFRYAFRDVLPRAVRRRPKTPLHGYPHHEKVRRDGWPGVIASPRLEAYATSSPFEGSTPSPSNTDAALRLVALSRWLAGLNSPAAAAVRR
jgi:asparagine synthase (glutamine-hydrolysing)